jgi:hypothetical protein
MEEEILTDHTGSQSDPAVAHPADESPTAESPAPSPELPAPDPPPPDSLAAHEAEYEERDDQGRFRPRHRAKSQQARAQDAPRIAELTRKLREAEAERDRLKQPGGNGTGAQTVSPLPVPRPQPQAQQPPPPAAKDDPEPKSDDFEDYTKFVTTHNRWAAREELRIERRQERERQQEQAKAQESYRLATSFAEKIQTARSEYPDFDQVALHAPSQIPRGSLIDAWIFEHASGAKVLYHLQKDPSEIARILRLPLLDQAEALTLLAQRLQPTPRAATVSSGAVPTLAPAPTPRPPTPLRTGPMRTGTELPSDDASLDEHEKFYHRSRR